MTSKNNSAARRRPRRIPEIARTAQRLAALLLALALPASGATLQRGQCPALDYPAPGDAAPASATLVIIIDDLGHQLANGRAAVALPGKLNYAVLPYTPYGKRLARAAHRGGKEVLLHAPMSNLAHKPLGRGALTPELDRAQFEATLDASLAQVPHVRGVNNHMGSDLTRRRPQMQWLMAQLSRRKLYFVDSRTEKGTVAADVASEQHVPNLSRQVFLDNQRSREAIAERFAHFTRLAREQGLAVAIGHPYPETIAYLREVLPGLRERGFRLALVSEALAAQGDPARRESQQLARRGDNGSAAD